MTGSKDALFFIDQPTAVIDQFRQWLSGTTIECVVVEPVNRAFSLVVRDNPWGVVLNIETEIGEKLCAQIREDELLESVRVVALSTGASAQALTDHMFGDFSADVYGKLPLEDGIVDVWLHKQLSSKASRSQSFSEESLGQVVVEAEIELSPELSTPPSSTKRVPDSTSDERVSRLELELFEQSEKLTTTNRSLLKTRLQLQEMSAQNSMLQAECTRLQDVLSNGSSDLRLRQEVNRLYERLRIAEEAIEQSQKQHVDVGLQAVESLSPQDLLREITLLRSVRDEKVEQINTLHGELQLTRQAVDTLQRRTEKAEARLTEVQNLGQVREQEMQREFATLQRQVSNGTRNLEIAQHREQQLSQQIDQLTNRLQEMERLHQAEQAHWLRKSEELSASTEKEAELLKEIDGLTEALQAQLMGGDGDEDGVESALIQSLEQRQESLQQALVQTQAKLSEVEARNIQLKQQMVERVNQSGGVDSAQWKRQQQVLDSTLKALEDSLARQDELEQKLELADQHTGFSAQNDSTLALENERLQEQIAQLQQNLREVSGAHQRTETTVDQNALAKLEEQIELLKRQHAAEIQRLQMDKRTVVGSPIGATEAQSVQRLSQSLEELEAQRVLLEGELSDTRRTVQELETERGRLQIALEDSQAMADAVEEATDLELAEQNRQVKELELSLRERLDAYQELETQTALVISERDEFWAQVEPLQEREKELETKLAELRQVRDAEQTEHQDQIDALTASLSTTEQELHTTQQALKANTTRLEELDGLVEELQVQAQEGLEVQQALESLEAENKALSEQRQGLLLEVDTLSAKQTTTIEALEQFEKTVAELTSQIATLEAEKSTLVEEKSTLMTDLEVQGAEVERLQGQLTAQKTEMERLQSELENSQRAMEESVSANTSLQESIVEIRRAEEEAKENALNEQKAALIAEHQSTLQELSDQHQYQKAEWQYHIDQLELEREQQRERALLDENDRIVSLQGETDALKERCATLEQQLQAGRDKIIDLENRLEALKSENDQLRTLEAQLNQVNVERQSLERELETVRTEWSDAQTSWDLERILIEQEAEQSTVNDARVQLLEDELSKIQQQRSELLDMIDDLTRAQEQSDSRIQELQGPADDVLLRVQQERDDALTELEMNALEIGIAQSAARQLAQQAERMRNDVLATQEEWMRKLEEKERENAHLRDTIDSMDKGLSSLFVKRPTF